MIVRVPLISELALYRRGLSRYIYEKLSAFEIGASILCRKFPWRETRVDLFLNLELKFDDLFILCIKQYEHDPSKPHAILKNEILDSKTYRV